MERLKRIKLVNFKSFADTTVIPITKRLTAIVGPNGCGKSNVVDAIRWVIGESSAKQLRGQSMSELIFNGTTQRKPVGKASVELIFDNADGWLGGEFSAFAEISVKREVERDGLSSYFINNTACNRRDILSVFLGTGLGSRSYSIIEQGMISRLVEAKPEGMRAYFEEVAGISKYKDRRRDTENRMRRTTENLERVNDIREELATQLRRLKRQANAAERYKVMKAEEFEVNAQIKALQWVNLDSQAHQQKHKISEFQVDYDEQLSFQRQVEVNIEEVRQKEVVCRQTEADVQKKFYEKTADIARIEEQIKNIEEQTIAWTSELSETAELLNEVALSTDEQRHQVDELISQKAQVESNKAVSRTELERSINELQQADSAMKSWQQEWDSFQQQFNHNSKQHGSAKTSLGHLTKQIEQWAGRIQQLHKSKDSVCLVEIEKKAHPLQEQVDSANVELTELQSAMKIHTDRLSEQRKINQDLKRCVKDLTQQSQQERAKLGSLQALQKAALSDDVSQTWLQDHQLGEAPRLGRCLTAANGWEVAVETVLSQQFNAVCIDSIESFKSEMTSIKEGEFLFVEKSDIPRQQSASSGTLLLDCVSSEWDLSPWLQGVYAASTWEEAWSLRQSLQTHESVVTKEGVWMGSHWLRVARSVDSEGSILLRQQSIEKSEAALIVLEKELEEAEKNYNDNEEQLLILESDRDNQHERFKKSSHFLTELQGKYSAHQSRLTELKSQQERLISEISEAKQHREELILQHDEVDFKVKELSELMVSSEEKKSDYLLRREQCREILTVSRDAKNEAQQAVDQVDIRVAAIDDQLAILQQTLSRQDRQAQQLHERHAYLSTHLESNDEGPLQVLKDTLQKELEDHLTHEKALKLAEQETHATGFNLSQLEKKKKDFVSKLSAIKDSIQSQQIKSQEVIVRQATLVEQLAVEDLVVQDVVDGLPDEATEETWVEKSSVLSTRINKLGVINIGAIDEYQALTERKEYLDHQYEDLDKALKMLDDSIKKIDRETRSRFKDTFERVNEGFKELFPKIFGGGAAYLELEENDLLTSGVILKAQPPGKRNSTIQMLSGGEKALTAVALVFALFRLNPAPFCVLDEVDAPLDDVNVGRFCNLIKEMSQLTQFLIISHNKVTIAMAEHLMGVTMHEAGVSRIVSVDVQSAIEMAEA
jgi:chromosome segregation protein